MKRDHRPPKSQTPSIAFPTEDCKNCQGVALKSQRRSLSGAIATRPHTCSLLGSRIEAACYALATPSSPTPLPFALNGLAPAWLSLSSRDSLESPSTADVRMKISWTERYVWSSPDRHAPAAAANQAHLSWLPARLILAPARIRDWRAQAPFRSAARPAGPRSRSRAGGARRGECDPPILARGRRKAHPA